MVRRDSYAVSPSEIKTSTNDNPTNITETYQKEDDATLPFSSFCNMAKMFEWGSMSAKKLWNRNMVRRDPYAVFPEEKTLFLFLREDDATHPFSSLCNITKKSEKTFGKKCWNLNMVRRDPYPVSPS